MVRVLATIQRSQYASSLMDEQTDLANWVKEIHSAMYPNMVRLLPRRGCHRRCFPRPRKLKKLKFNSIGFDGHFHQLRRCLFKHIWQFLRCRINCPLGEHSLSHIHSLERHVPHCLRGEVPQGALRNKF